MTGYGWTGLSRWERRDFLRWCLWKLVLHFALIPIVLRGAVWSVGLDCPTSGWVYVWWVALGFILRPPGKN